MKTENHQNRAALMRGFFVAVRRGDVPAPMNGPAALLLCTLLGACAGLDGYGSDHTPVGSDGGFSAQRLAALTRMVQADIDAKRIPGAVLLAARNGKVAYDQALGARNPKTGAPMTEDSIFRIYSMSKPIVSVGAMMLMEDGKLTLDAPVSQYLPELKGLRVGVEKVGGDGKPTLELVPVKDEMTVHDLLRHTSGFIYEHKMFGDTLLGREYRMAGVTDKDIVSTDDLVKKLAHLPLAYQPGTTWEYGRSYDVLGALIERISGKPLDVYLSERILEPLKMDDTGFWVEPGKQDRLAEAFELGPDDEQPIGWLSVRSKPSFLSGGAGMVSTARDYLRFAQMLLNGGQLDGVRILSRKTVEYMTSGHFNGIPGPTFSWLVGPGYSYGLGFEVRTATGMAPTPGSVGDYGWYGYAGTAFWVDPRERLVAICMIQAPGQNTCGLFANMLEAAME
jgi:CubicO group peptidase (beta-lactamase class C family)